jgi:hypothetical protein
MSLLPSVRDFLQRASLLHISGEKSNHSTGTCDGDGEPDNAPKRPAETVLLPHGDECEDDAGQAQEYNQPQA